MNSVSCTSLSLLSDKFIDYLVDQINPTSTVVRQIVTPTIAPIVDRTLKVAKKGGVLGQKRGKYSKIQESQNGGVGCDFQFRISMITD